MIPMIKTNEWRATDLTCVSRFHFLFQYCDDMFSTDAAIVSQLIEEATEFENRVVTETGAQLDAIPILMQNRPPNLDHAQVIGIQWSIV